MTLPRETDQQRRERIAREEQAMTAIRSLVEAYTAGGVTFRQAAKSIEDVLDEEVGRIVRVGQERHNPEVTT